MHAVTTIGLDIAKSVFQVHGIDAAVENIHAQDGLFGPTMIEPIVAEPRSTPMPMKIAINPMPNIPILRSRRTWLRAVCNRRRATIVSIAAARTKRMRLVVAGPKLSLASL